MENIIQGMFAVARLMASDVAANTGRQLAQALSQISGTGAQSIGDWTAMFVAEVERAISQGDVCDDVDPAEAGEAIWVAMLGTHLLSNALGDDIDARLVKVWRVLLRAIVPAESRTYFLEFVKRASVRPSPSHRELTLTAQ